MRAGAGHWLHRCRQGFGENRVDGKTLCSADFDCLLTMDMSEGGLGLTPMQKVRLKREMEAATQR